MNRDWYGFVVSFRSSLRSFNFLEDDENQVASDLFYTLQNVIGQATDFTKIPSSTSYALASS